MTDKNPFNDIEEMERSGFSDYSILICTALSEFLWAYDIVQRTWLEQSGSFAEPLDRLNLARLKVRKFFDPQTVTPPGQTGIQFGAGLFNLIEEAWHLCRFVSAYRPDSHPKDADGKTRLNDMLSRPPVIREEIRKAWLHLKHVALLEARDARAVSDSSESSTPPGGNLQSHGNEVADKPSREQQPSQPDGPLEPDGFCFNGKPAWGLTPDEKKLMTFVWVKRDTPPTWIDTAFHLCPTKRVNGLPVASSQDFYTVIHRLKKKLVDQGWKAWIRFAGRGATTRGKVVLREPIKRSKKRVATKQQSTPKKLSTGGSSNKRPTKKKRASNA